MGCPPGRRPPNRPGGIFAYGAWEAGIKLDEETDKLNGPSQGSAAGDQAAEKDHCMSKTTHGLDPRGDGPQEAAHTVFHLKLGMRQGRVTIRPDSSRGNLGHAHLRRPQWINHPPTTTREEHPSRK